MVENTIIQMARSGQIVNKFGEDQLKSLLERVSEQTQKKTVVRVNIYFSKLVEKTLIILINF